MLSNSKFGVATTDSGRVRPGTEKCMNGVPRYDTMNQMFRQNRLKDPRLKWLVEARRKQQPLAAYNTMPSTQ